MCVCVCLWGGGLTPLQKIQSADSNAPFEHVCLGGVLPLCWGYSQHYVSSFCVCVCVCVCVCLRVGVLPLCRRYSQQILMPLLCMCVFGRGRLTPLHEILSAYFKPLLWVCLGGCFTPLQGIQSMFSKPYGHGSNS